LETMAIFGFSTFSRHPLTGDMCSVHCPVIESRKYQRPLAVIGKPNGKFAMKKQTAKRLAATPKSKPVVLAKPLPKAEPLFPRRQ